MKVRVVESELVLERDLLPIRFKEQAKEVIIACQKQMVSICFKADGDFICITPLLTCSFYFVIQSEYFLFEGSISFKEAVNVLFRFRKSFNENYEG